MQTLPESIPPPSEPESEPDPEPEPDPELDPELDPDPELEPDPELLESLGASSAPESCPESAASVAPSLLPLSPPELESPEPLSLPPELEPESPPLSPPEPELLELSLPGTHWPPVHESPALHTRPHMPQFCGSCWRFAQTAPRPLHSVSPPGHASGATVESVGIAVSFATSAAIVESAEPSFPPDDDEDESGCGPPTSATEPPSPGFSLLVEPQPWARAATIRHPAPARQATRTPRLLSSSLVIDSPPRT